MRTFRQPFKYILILFLGIAIFLGYSPAFAESAETNDKDAPHQGHNGFDWPGLYHGFPPCADCMGIKTTLALNKNNTYILITQNVGKSIREFVEKGKFTWGDKANTIILTPRKSSDTKRYLVGENTLIQLDNKGERISGADADRYILRRTDVSNAPPEHTLH
jgi:copper homeostasis protein (lipoprotein)